MRRFQLHASDDMLRILGVVRSGSNYRDQPVCVAEKAFPKMVWIESDEAGWFRMVEREAELADGFASPGEEPPIPHARIASVAEALSTSTYHLAKLLPDYGDVIAELSHIGILSLADAARYLNVKKCRVDQLRMQGRLGAAVRFSGRLFLRRESVEAYAEWKRRDIEAFWERIRKLKAEERRGRRG